MARHLANTDEENIPAEATDSEELPASQAVEPIKPLDAFESPAVEEERRSSGTFIKAIFGLIALAAVVYLAGAAFFMFHFFPNTTVDGRDVSLNSVDSLEDAIDTSLGDFVTKISGDGLDLNVKASDIQLGLDTRAYAHDAKNQQNPWIWPAMLNGTHEISVKRQATFDIAILDSMLDPAIEAINQSAVPTQDASIAFSEEEGRFVVVDEVWGTQIDPYALKKNVYQGISQMEKEIVLDEESLVQPQVPHDDDRIVKAVEDANRYATCEIPLRVGGVDAVSIAPAVIKDWVVLGENFEVTFDQDKAIEWMKGPLSDILDTAGSERSYTRPDGASYTVSGGSYGYVIDSEALAPIVVEHIQQGNTEPIDVPCKQEGQFWAPRGTKDWGETYIDINLSSQYAYYYVDGGVVWESYIVSGKTSDGHGTPTGVFAVTSYKTRHTTLIGLDEDHDGEPDYETDVEYWIPFSGNLVALHDADWRYSFGGDIYTWNGSHGCVNLPVGKAAELYDIADVGTVVVVHW